MWPEVNGTITNHEGKVQRLRAAVPPPGQARPHWHLLTQLIKGLNDRPVPTSAKQVFETMQAQVEAFRDASWGKEMPTISLRFAGRRG